MPNALLPAITAQISLVGLLLLALGCSGSQPVERSESEVDTDPRRPPTTAHIEARPTIESALDDAIEGFDANIDDFRLLISQQGRLAPISNHTVSLRPMPFTIWVVARHDAAALVNVWYSPQARNAVIRGHELPGELGQPATGMAEAPFNEDQQLLLHREASNYWFYHDDSQHRFDDVEIREGLFIGKRKVIQFRDVERDEIKPVSEFAGSSVSMIEFEYRSMEKSPPKRAYTIEFASTTSP